MAVARQKLLDPERSSAVSRTDYDDTSGSMRNDFYATKDECSHENIAQLAVCLHQRQETLAIQLDHFSRPVCPDFDERAPAREHVDLAGEHAGFEGKQLIAGGQAAQ